MIKETFVNLSDEKKKKIADSVYHVLEENRYRDVTISMIIKEAGIPRGSFYQYFDDKEDAVRYMFAGIRMEIGKAVYEGLISHDGLLSDYAEKALDMIIEFGSKSSNMNVFKNAFSDMNILALFVSDAFSDRQCLKDEMMKIIVRTYGECEGLDIAIDMGISIFKDAVFECFIEMENKSITVDRFKRKLEIISKGLTKEEDRE